MATNHTTNYQLNLWEPTDTFSRAEINENTQKLDAAVKAVDTKANGKADAAAVSALTQTVAGLTQTVTAVTQNDLIFDLTLTQQTGEIVIPLPAGYRSKYRQLALYAELKSSQSNAYAYLYLTDAPETKGVMVTGGNFASSCYGSLSTISSSLSSPACFNRVIFDLTSPRVCSLAYTVKSYLQTNSDPDDFRSTGNINFYASRTLTWDQVTKVRLVGSNPLLVGSDIKLYGIR